MPREIKFRAFIKNNNGMNQSHYEHMPKMLDVVSIDLEREEIVARTPSLWDWGFSDIELMQYTGLKDKNGVEIWEGDVVRIPTGYKFLVSMAHFSLGYEGSGAYGYAYYKHGEVLGNLYENQELLGDKDAN